MNNEPNRTDLEIERMGEAIRANAGFVALFVLGVLHLLGKISFDWPVIVVFVIAILPSLARIIEYLKASKDGVEVKMRSGFAPATEVENTPPRGTLTETVPGRPETRFGKLTVDEKKILKALWHFQKNTFGIDSPTRWGFMVGHMAPDFVDFILGVGLLNSKGWISMNQQGMVFLSHEGLVFCREHEPELDSFPLYYSKF